MRDNTESEYKKYHAEFKQMRKEGLVKRGARMLTKRQFRDTVEQVKLLENKGTAYARKALLESQSKFAGLSEAKLQKLYKTYVKQGYKVVSQQDWNQTEVTTSTKFRSFESFKRNLSAHQSIALMIDSGMTRQQALEEYGY